MRRQLKGAILLAALTLWSSSVLLAQSILSMPPEPRSRVPHFTMPEDLMTQANLARQAAERDDPMKDAQGRVRYIIDLTDAAPLSEPSLLTQAPSDSLPVWHKPQMRNLAAHMAAEYGFVPTGITSWVENSITAFLTPDQLAKLQQDHRVTRVTPDYKVQLSGSVWSDTGGP